MSAVTGIESCAFVGCDKAQACALVGGCVSMRFPATAAATERELPAAKALNGTSPRASRDPRFIKRRRKAL